MSRTTHTCFDLHNWKCNIQQGMKNIQMSMDMGWLPVISCEKSKSIKSFLLGIPKLTNSCKKGSGVVYLLLGNMKNQHQQRLKRSKRLWIWWNCSWSCLTRVNVFIRSFSDCRKFLILVFLLHRYYPATVNMAGGKIYIFGNI